MTASDAGGRVVRVTGCDLAVEPGAWAFAEDRREEIEEHWVRRKAEGAPYFNGVIHLMRRHSISDAMFTARFVPTDFKSYLYWRDSGFPDEGVADAFGSALVRSAEGHVLLGRQRAGNINSGLTYLPGGFIDAHDVAADGQIDIEGSIARELLEETGLAGPALERVPGYLVTFAGPLLSIAAEFLADLPSQTLRETMLGHLRGDAQSELVDIIVVRSAGDLEGLAMPPYARVLLTSLFGAP